jgi:hypothetical protein
VYSIFIEFDGVQHDVLDPSSGSSSPSSFACILLFTDSSCPQFPESLVSAVGRIFSPVIFGASTPSTTTRGARTQLKMDYVVHSRYAFQIAAMFMAYICGCKEWLMLSWALHFILV